ncbi:hypothetical protein N0V90_013156 [Kalmusia sp. IMI 367209]|nr:hypothetical protein N0V90_013156 [Kalmusia sp. IMI 367209]
MFALLPFALLLELFARVEASPVDAPHPMITQRAELWPREAPIDFVGYYYTTDGNGNSVITSSQKSGSRLTLRDSTLVDWCSDDSSYLSAVCPTAYWTSCSGVTLYSQGGSSSCATTCDYDIVYTANTADSNSLRWFHCMDRPYLLFYREQPTGTLIEDATTASSSSTESSTESSSDSSTVSSSETASPASSGTTTVASQTTDPTSTPTPEPKEKGSSKAWIAGVVIGVVGLLAVAGMAFYLWRQRQQNKPQAYQPAPQGPQLQPGYPPQQMSYPLQQQQSYGNGASPGQHPVSPNMTAYDAQNYYGQTPKPQEGVVYPQYAGPPPGVGTVQMPMQAQPQAQPHMGVSVQELPELAPPTTR